MGSSANEFTYTGEQNDSTGLEYLRARYYDNATGRFLSQDPLGLPQQYPYVGNNPANLIDPYGLIGLPGIGELPCPGCGVIADCVSDPVDCGEDAFDFLVESTYPRRAQLTIALERAFIAGSAGDTEEKEGGLRLITNCRGLCELVRAPAFTIGHTVFTTQPGIQPDTLAHERRHVGQYELLGDLFWIIYGGNAAVSAVACVKNAGGLPGGYYDCIRATNVLEVLAQ